MSSSLPDNASLAVVSGRCRARLTRVGADSYASRLTLEAKKDVRVGKGDSGLPQPSVVNVSQLITLDRSVLSKKVKALPGTVMEKIDVGIKLVLALQ